MTTRSAILLTLLLGLVCSVNAQDNEKQSRKEKKSAKQEVAEAQSKSAATPRDMWEFGVSGGHAFVSGDVDFEPGYGVGLHFRKALDYPFSIRVDGNYSMVSGNNYYNERNRRQFEGTWMSGTGFGVLSLNNMRWDKSVRKFNLYALLGGGVHMYEATYSVYETREGKPFVELDKMIEGELTPHAAAGAGLSLRLSPRINVGLEHQLFFVFGKRADLLDGVQGGTSNRTAFRDIFNFTALNININLGNASSRSEPLYWVNPMDKFMNDVADVKARQEDFTTDTDNDGVIDALDQEPNTPRDATVDTKGRTLDSDRDGVADYKDKEPYYTPRPGETVNSLGVVENPIGGGRGGVTEDRVKELIDEALVGFRDNLNTSGGGAGQLNPGGGVTNNYNNAGAAVTEWFLPMIHFGSDSYSVKYSDYGTLASIARMMKGNPNMKLVVTGFTDQTAPENYNNNLSYSRAKSVIDHLVNNLGIGRGRLVLQWRGEGEALVPAASSYMNRRVEFRVARPDDVEMDPPAAKSADGF